MDSVMRLLKEVECEEKGAEEAKEEAIQSCTDIIAKMAECRQTLLRVEKTKDALVKESSILKDVLATKLEDLNLRLAFLMDNGDKSLKVLDEMHKALEIRLSSAIQRKELAGNIQKENEECYLEVLSSVESETGKMVEKSNILKQEAVETSKMLEFLVDRGNVVDMLHEEISNKCRHVKLLKEELDQIGGKSFSVSSSSTGHHGSIINDVQDTYRLSTPSMETSKKVLSSNVVDCGPSKQGLNDNWSKRSTAAGPGWDPRLKRGYPKRGNHGVFWSPRGQLPGPRGSPMHQGNNSDSEVSKIMDEEQAKQRQLKRILNNLTPQNFEKRLNEVKRVNVNNVNTLFGLVYQIYEKALMEPTFVEMYARMCSRLSAELPDFSENNEKITFKRLLLNKCQEEFERGEREQQEGEVKHTQEGEEKGVKSRRRMLGNIRLIGELYKKKLLTERIMHECINKLLGQYQNPDEEDIEALCKLMSTVGEMIDHPRAKEFMDAYFGLMFRLSNSMYLSSRVRIMLKDLINLRENKWH